MPRDAVQIRALGIHPYTFIFSLPTRLMGHAPHQNISGPSM
jgi:hypothetical protein